MRAFRYSLLTQVREFCPDSIAKKLPFPQNCGSHEWVRLSVDRDGCRHCLTDREHVPTPIVVGSPEWNGLLSAAAGGSDASAKALAFRIEETERAAQDAARAAAGAGVASLAGALANLHAVARY